MDARLPLIEIRDWSRRPRRVALARPIVVGRDCDGEILADSEVSRPHLRLVPSPTALSVVDEAKRFRQLAVAIPQVRISPAIAVSPRQEGL